MKEKCYQFQTINLGANLIPENLETGEYKIAGVADFDELKPLFIVAYAGTTFNGVSLPNWSRTYNGMPSSVMFILCDSEGLNSTLATINTQDQQGEAIVTVFSIPRLPVLSIYNSMQEMSPVQHRRLLGDTSYNQAAITKTLTARPSTIDGYTPRNKKLLQYPFLYLAFNPSNRITKYISL